MAGNQNFYVYILTNKGRNVLYIGVTNNLARRVHEHETGFNEGSFTSRYKVFFLIYYERFQYINNAIDREKEIKGWRRSKKDELIKEFNPQWRFLNDELG